MGERVRQREGVEDNGLKLGEQVTAEARRRAAAGGAEIGVELFAPGSTPHKLPHLSERPVLVVRADG